MKIKKLVNKKIKRFKEWFRKDSIQKYWITGKKWIALILLYIVGKIFGVNLLKEFSDQITIAILYYAGTKINKLTGTKLEIWNNQQFQEKLKEGIVYAEGKGIEHFKKTGLFLEGEKKINLAAAMIAEKYPKLTQEQIIKNIQEKFATIQPELTTLWTEMANNILTKNALKQNVDKT